MGRQAQSNIRLIVEGETEINYFEQMKKREKRIILILNTMHACILSNIKIKKQVSL